MPIRFIQVAYLYIFRIPTRYYRDGPYPYCHRLLVGVPKREINRPSDHSLEKFFKIMRNYMNYGNVFNMFYRLPFSGSLFNSIK